MQETGLVQSVLDYVIQNAHGLGAVVLFGSSLVEYVFPPFPGDVITLLGAWLVVVGSWSFAYAMLVVCGGSLVGAAIDYGIGRWLGGRLDKLPSEKDRRGFVPLTREKYELLLKRFSRHGAAYILVNRFLPGIRAFFFVAAGAARIPLIKVLIYAAVSALVWNALLLGAGYAVGANLERLKALFASYTMVIWCLLGALAIGGLVVYFLRRRRARAGRDVKS